MSQTIDITLLQVMKHRVKYVKYYRQVSEKVLDSKTKTILKDFGKYLDGHPDCESIPISEAFYTWFCLAHPKLEQEKLAVYRKVFEEVAKDADPQVESILSELLLEANSAYELGELLIAYQRGDEINFKANLDAIQDAYTKGLNRNVKIPFIEMNGSIFDDTRNGRGFMWSHEGLNEVMRPMVGGDSIIVAARPDKGKTTFLCDNARTWVQQLPELYPDDWQERSIIWFNNEGKGQRIVARFIQSCLGVKMSEVAEMEAAGTLWDAFARKVPHMNALRVLDIHGYKHWQIEDILKKVKPAMVIFDMLDNIKFDGLGINGGSRTDQMLEAMYSWAREIACIHNVPVLETSQLSAEAEGLAWPTQAMLKDSRTGKQGACDAILNLGSVNDPSAEAIRFVSLTKNKLRNEGKPQSCRLEIILDNSSARFI